MRNNYDTKELYNLEIVLTAPRVEPSVAVNRILTVFFPDAILTPNHDVVYSSRINVFEPLVVKGKYLVIFNIESDTRFSTDYLFLEKGTQLSYVYEEVQIQLSRRGIRFRDQ